jgi:dihydropteroate synthase
MNDPKILGIVNITSDSFSDGGEYLNPDIAIRHCQNLIAQGADILDLGAQSSNPNANQISEEEEWDRLEPVIRDLRKNHTTDRNRILISIDSYRPIVLRNSLKFGIDFWNDITALKNPDLEKILIGAGNPKDLPNLILMYSHSHSEIARKESHLTKENIILEITDFLIQKKKRFIELGIPEEKLIFDPGMGFFLGSDPQLSLEVLRNLGAIKDTLGKILISVSRKSFLGNLLNIGIPKERNIASLAAELWAYKEGVDYIRTHEPSPLRQSITLWKELSGN